MSTVPQRYSVGVVGLGKYIPERVIGNAEVEERTGLPPGTVEKRTGIRTRHIVTPEESASSMSLAAARAALGDAGVSAEELGLILACTFSADYVMPALACKVHQGLGAKNAGAFDIMANCTAFQVGASLASDRLRCDPSLRYSLVLGTAVVSRYLNWYDADTSIYFGDGAGAAVLGPVPDGFGFLAHEVFSVTAAYESVRLRGGGSSYPLRAENIHEHAPYLEMNGMDVWKQVLQHQPRVIRQALAKANLALEDVDFFIFHQANRHLIDYFMGKLRLPREKTYTNVERLGNTAEASIPIALCEAAEQGLIKHNDIVVMSGVGAGFTFGASVMRWYQPTGDA
ncbi:MAG: ketoacyl-ACP synthase III [Chloroflexi bacterium]|nr:ketoacyl-ACP synthase III [Chloroflexota bacterium]